MKLIILQLILSIFLYADMSQCKVKFSTTEMRKVEKEFGKIATNRVNDYIKEMRFLNTQKRPKKMILLNNYLNQMLPEYDAVTQNAIDHWATPKEFLKIGHGDCEDYAIIKYYSLQTLGYDEKNLYFAVVKELFSGTNHMVLFYYPHNQEEPYVLDNLSFRILKMAERTDLSVKYIFNQSGSYLVTKNGVRLNKTNLDMSLFYDLRRRVDLGE